MWLNDSYDVPQELVDSPPSPEFRQFLLNWFGSNSVRSGERFRSARCLVGEELALGRELMRRNLKSRRDRIVHGTWILGDMEAIPVLREMFSSEPNESHRLIIAGALWKLCKDPVFIECLNRARGTSLMGPHMDQVLWLDDERAVDFLIDLLPTEDEESRRRRRGVLSRFSRVSRDREDEGSRALLQLNHLEAGQLFNPRAMSPASYYRERRDDHGFRERMVEAVHKAAAAPPRM